MSDLAITPTGQMSSGDDDLTKRLRHAADQVEGLFLQLLFKQLEESKEGEESLLGDSAASNQFNQLLHGALSEKSAGSLGISDAVFQQLAVKAGLKPAATVTPVENKP
jgi:Rod binding domain-containing protein